jgi:hypothetical protein
MSERANPGPPEDSLDAIERVIAIEEAFDELLADPRLTSAQRESLIHEFEARFERGEFGGEDDFDDDALAAMVRKLGPRSPRGQAGAAARPEE